MFVRHLNWLSGPSNPASSGHEHRFFYLVLSIFFALKNAVGFSYATPILRLSYAYATPMLHGGA